MAVRGGNLGSVGRVRSWAFQRRLGSRRWMRGLGEESVSSKPLSSPRIALISGRGKRSGFMAETMGPGLRQAQQQSSTTKAHMPGPGGVGVARFLHFPRLEKPRSARDGREAPVEGRAVSTGVMRPARAIAVSQVVVDQFHKRGIRYRSYRLCWSGP
jgi:hypothetical protein